MAVEKSKTPERKRSYRQMVAEILENDDFRKDMHALVRKARKGDAKAEQKLLDEFEITPAEAKELGLDKTALRECLASNNTTFMLLDFAKMVD